MFEKPSWEGERGRGGFRIWQRKRMEVGNGVGHMTVGRRKAGWQLEN